MFLQNHAKLIVHEVPSSPIHRGRGQIFGPLTIKQFLYIGGGAAICFIIYHFLGLILSIIPIVIVAGFFLALAFYRPNQKPFINMVEAAFNYSLGRKLYIWKKAEGKATSEMARNGEEADVTSSFTVPKLSDSKLRDLTWSLDVNESLYAGLKNKNAQRSAAGDELK